VSWKTADVHARSVLIKLSISMPCRSAKPPSFTFLSRSLAVLKAGAIRRSKAGSCTPGSALVHDRSPCGCPGVGEGMRRPALHAWDAQVACQPKTTDASPGIKRPGIYGCNIYSLSHNYSLYQAFLSWQPQYVYHPFPPSVGGPTCTPLIPVSTIAFTWDPVRPC
jgi:hypothetical protein